MLNLIRNKKNKPPLKRRKKTELKLNTKELKLYQKRRRYQPKLKRKVLVS